jgi:hypothetical protein
VSVGSVHYDRALTGCRVVIPPPFLCCGFPAHANAKVEQHSRTVLRDTILFSQIREMFSHLAFDACVVTCGTCREGLEQMEAQKLFGGRIVDVARYASERGPCSRRRRRAARAGVTPALPRPLDGEVGACWSIGGFGKVGGAALLPEAAPRVRGRTSPTPCPRKRGRSRRH